MKKKIFAVVLCMALAVAFAGCGSGAVSEEEYEALLAENETLQRDLQSKQTEIDTLTAENERLNGEISELESQAAAAAEAESGNILEAGSGIQLYGDEYVTLSYLGCQLDDRDGEEQMVFHVANKTDVELTFQSSSLAINGEDLGHISGSDGIAAQSKGDIVFTAENEFPTMLPATITGVITVIDFSDVLLERSYDISFVNVAVGDDESSVEASADAPGDEAAPGEATGETVEYEGIRFVLPDAASGHQEDGSQIYNFAYDCVVEGQEGFFYAYGTVQAWFDVSLLADDPLEFVIYFVQQSVDEVNVMSEDSIEVAGKQGLLQQGMNRNNGVEYPFTYVFFEGDEGEDVIYVFTLSNLLAVEDFTAELRKLIGDLDDLADPDADFFKMLETVEFI